MNDPQAVLSAFGNILNSYYTVALAQSARSFLWAIIAAGVGVALFVGAIVFLLYEQSVEVSVVSAIGGAIVELVAGLNFYLYGKAIDQAASHRSSLEKMQRYLLANSIVESLTTDDEKDESRSKLISVMAEEDPDSSRKRKNRGKQEQGSRDGTGDR
jgi:hypothetical protein